MHIDLETEKQFGDVGILTKYEDYNNNKKR